MEYTSSNTPLGADTDAGMDLEDLPVVDMGYEHQPQPRRGSMSHTQEKERRASIKSIMSNPLMSPMTKRRSIQHLMDGRRNSMLSGHSQSTSSISIDSSVGDDTPDMSSSDVDSCVGGIEVLDLMSDNTADYGYCDGNLDNNECKPATSNNNCNTKALYYSNEQTKRTELTRPPCSHYERNCTIISPCCGAAFGCRICHDDSPSLPPKINFGKRYNRSASLPGGFTNMCSQDNSVPEDTHHKIDRFAIKEVICRVCYTRQSSKTNNCVNCNVQFGAYHCNICNLWMSDEEKPYHCPDCGFCRVGGAENFRHCHDCGMCIDKKLYDNHNCKAGKYRSNCPVCQEYLFSSRSASHEMPCGHAIHWDCFRQLVAHDSRCPVCKKTAEARERMIPTWQAMAASIAMQPVPPDLARVVDITCNDCEKQTENRPWHFLGFQCLHCQSFNTVVDRFVLSGQEAHDFLVENIPDYNNPDNVTEEQVQQSFTGEEATNLPQPRRQRMNRRRSAF